MKKSLLAIFTICTLLGSSIVSKKKIVEGNLYFKLVDFPQFFDAPDSILTKLEAGEKFINTDTLKEEDKKVNDLVQFLAYKKLLRRPFIRLRQDDGKIIMVFLDPVDYDKVKNYNHQDLLRDNKKIRIKAEISEIDYDSLTVYKTLKIISVRKLDGKTYWDK